MKSKLYLYPVHLICLLGLFVLCIIQVDVPLVYAQKQESSLVNGSLILVTNTSEVMNGDFSSVDNLLANPGDDGISLIEAVLASQATEGYETIRFSSALEGSTIQLQIGIPILEIGDLTIDGNIDDDVTPDIIIDGSISATDTAFKILGGSHVVIKGFQIQNFSKHGVSISPDTTSGKSMVEDVVVFQNIISTTMNAVEVGSWKQDYTTIQNVEIASNIFQNGGGGVAVHSGMSDGEGGGSNNVISDIKILNNVIDNPGYNIAVFLSPSSSTGLNYNTISNIEVRGNTIRNHLNTSVLVDSSNQAICNYNKTENIIIAENYISGDHVTIEIVGESGMYSHHNSIDNLAILDNYLVGGGVQFSGATGYSAHDNSTTNISIERNQIVNGLANGIYIIAGSGGAYNNSIENVLVRSNFIAHNQDAGILLHGDTSASPNNTINNVVITNQTIINNAIGPSSSWAGGVNVNTKYSGNTITNVSLTNSILWENVGGDLLKGALVPSIVENNFLNDPRYLGIDGNFYGTPGFEDEANGDFHLDEYSDCIDRGGFNNDNIGDKDLDNNVRLWDGDNDSVSVVDLGAWEYNAPAIQEIQIKGNGIIIPSGDILPVTWDGTECTSQFIGDGPTIHAFSIENIGQEPLELGGTPVVEIEGLNASDFSVVSQPSTQIDGGQLMDFSILFSPTNEGLRKAIVSIVNNDSDETPYTFTIQGTGILSTEPEKDYLFLPLLLK